MTMEIESDLKEFLENELKQLANKHTKLIKRVADGKEELELTDRKIIFIKQKLGMLDDD